MPTVWILPSANTVLSEMFSAAGWLVTLPGQADTREPDVGVYEVGHGPLSDDFRAFCQMKFFPLLVLAANWDLAWAAIEAGADDAIVGRIASDEVLVRARRLVRTSKIVRVDDLIIDLGAQRVARGNRLIHVSPVEFRLLTCLAKHIGEAVSFDQILDDVRGTDPDQGGTLEQVKSAIKHLRRKLEPDPSHPQFIITVRSFGYRLRSPAQWDDNLEDLYD